MFPHLTLVCDRSSIDLAAGITPMRAMFHDLVWRGTSVTLLYSVRSHEESAFAEVRCAQLAWICLTKTC